ncbi:hypothetical protein CABS01_13906 [Colletotrichum abscissum]|uniref:uncharacterized protein n=1 Tax=Colletotrichum abscissum TaxID=1671311 RepID=UPI0027D5DE38|nr:uncharacterized protein CABS01_13906 [Colletotrichum abscissum]KAK1483754.1 hypothetical protein CABS01_13906 [Colletotrichum abscissum]
MCSTSMLCVPISPSFPPYLSIPLLTHVQFPLHLQLLLDGLSLNLAKRKKGTYTVLFSLCLRRLRNV